MSSTAVFYASTKENTKKAALQIAEKLDADIFNVADNQVEELSKYENLIFGSPTYGEGELHEDWVSFIKNVEKLDLSGKTIAIFGLGSGIRHAEFFVNAIGTIYNTIKDKNCKIIGFTNTEGYLYEKSTAIVDGKFVGLPLDNKEQSELTDDRINNWVNQLKSELG